MNELKLIENGGQVVESSRKIAKRFGKEHKNVLQAIENLMAENSAVKSMFMEGVYALRGKAYPEYLMSRVMRFAYLPVLVA